MLNSILSGYREQERDINVGVHITGLRPIFVESFVNVRLIVAEKSRSNRNVRGRIIIIITRNVKFAKIANLKVSVS